MYLSTLLVNTGDNPDRPDWNIARRWLRNLYRVHQRLCMAFPSAKRVETDPLFLAPYLPTDFPEQRHGADQRVEPDNADYSRQVHAKRNDESGFLFRIDPRPGGRVAIVVLSALKPDWDYAFGLKPGLLDPRTGRPIGNAAHLLAGPPAEPRLLQVKFEAGSQFGFCLVANPVFRVRAASVDRSGRPFDGKWVGKRVPVPSDDDSLKNWLSRRAARAGFELREVCVARTGFVYVNRNSRLTGGQRLRSVHYSGVLEVTDPQRFRAALTGGIGPGKAFGFGLLSLKPLSQPAAETGPGR